MKTLMLLIALSVSLPVMAEGTQAVPAEAAPPPLFKWEQPRPYEIGFLVTAHALIWVDVLQSIDRTRRPLNTWAESNPLLGRHPTPARFIWMGGVLPMLALTLVWYVLPTHWRVMAPAAVIAPELNITILNHLDGLRIRF